MRHGTVILRIKTILLRRSIALSIGSYPTLRSIQLNATVLQGSGGESFEAVEGQAPDLDMNEKPSQSGKLRAVIIGNCMLITKCSAYCLAAYAANAGNAVNAANALNAVYSIGKAVKITSMQLAGRKGKEVCLHLQSWRITLLDLKGTRAFCAGTHRRPTSNWRAH